MNIYCSGIGDPAVIFESGGAGPGLAWEPIQTEASKFTRACWYDRAGEGWSDPGPFPRTSAAIANDLHELLKQAGIRPPLVLAGASFGGLNSRVYTGLYPREVAGLVPIDSSHEDEPSHAPKFYLARTLPRYLWYPVHLLLPTAAATDTRAKAAAEILSRQHRHRSRHAGELSASARKWRLGRSPVDCANRRPAPAFDDPALAREAAAARSSWRIAITISKRKHRML